MITRLHPKLSTYRADASGGVKGTEVSAELDQIITFLNAPLDVTSPLTITGTLPTLTFVDTNGEDFNFQVDGDTLSIINSTGPITFVNFRGGANDDIQMQRKTTFDDDVVITDDHLQINTSAGLNANNRLIVNHNESPATIAVASFRAGQTTNVPLDLVTEASQSASAFRIFEDNDATERLRISSDGLVETRAGNGATPSTGFISLGGTLETITGNVGNITTGEDDLQTFTVPDNTLATDGDYLEIEIAVFCDATANNKRIRVYYAGNPITGADTGAQQYQGELIGRFTLIRISSTLIRANFVMALSTGTVTAGPPPVANGIQFHRTGLPLVSATHSNANVFKVTGEATNTNEIIQTTTVIKKFSNQ